MDKMTEDEFKKKFDEMNKVLGNSEKIAMMAIIAITKLIESGAEPKDMQELMMRSFSALRGQVIHETMMSISDDGKAFGMPNNGESFKAEVAMYAMMSSKYADWGMERFKEIVERLVPEHIKMDAVDRDDPRVNPDPSRPAGESLH